MAAVLAGYVAGMVARADAGVVVFVSVCLLLATLQNTPRLRVGPPDVSRVMSVTTFVVAALAVAVAWTGWTDVDLRHGIVVVVASVAAGVLARSVLCRAQPAMRVALVGEPDAVRACEAQWLARDDLVVVGALATPASDDPAWTDLEGLRTRVQALDADIVVVLPSGPLGARVVEQLCWALETTGVKVAVQLGLESVGRHRLRVNHLRGVSLAAVGSSRAGRGTLVAKDVFDRTVALVALVVAAPMLVVIAVLVRLDSPGPAVFRQVRSGRDGRPFVMYKFRTMVQGAEQLKPALVNVDEGNGVLFKMHHDPRLTRLGRFLRPTSLDELPQLVNVVLGQMSLVGPRPALPSEVELYDARARRRLQVTPGLTGPWQVSGRSTLTWDESVALDVRYADNISIAGDLAICLETVRAVASRRGAY